VLSLVLELIPVGAGAEITQRAISRTMRIARAHLVTARCLYVYDMLADGRLLPAAFVKRFAEIGRRSPARRRRTGTRCDPGVPRGGEQLRGSDAGGGPRAQLYSCRGRPSAPSFAAAFGLRP